MQEIPLFPLNTVLFPTMPLPLRIFEDRYKQMLAHCLEEDTSFGVVLIRSGRAEFGPLAEPHAIGCTAQIMQVQPLGDGQSFVMSMGHERFRILSLKQDKPYLTGQVEMLPFADESETAVQHAATKLQPQLWDYLQRLSRLGQLEMDAASLPADSEPKRMAYLAASVLQAPNAIKQNLLEEDRLSRLLLKLHRVYTRENTLMRTMPEDDLEPFSLN